MRGTYRRAECLSEREQQLVILAAFLGIGTRTGIIVVGTWEWDLACKGLRTATL